MKERNQRIQRRSHSFTIIHKTIFSIEDTYKQNITRNSSSSKAAIFKKKKDKFKTDYTTICQKFYPLIIKQNIYESCKQFSYFCLTCNLHLYDKSRNKHKDHSIISLKKIEIMDEDIIKMEKSIDKKMDNLLKSTSQSKSNDPKLELQRQNEITNLRKFNHFIVEQYKNNKYNFYNFFNFDYLFKLKDDIKNGKNDLLRKFFTVHSYKILCHIILNYLERKKKIWLLKHIIGYKKNEINEAKLKLRKERYNFKTLDILLKDEGFDESMINKMDKIIKEVKDREELKNKIFKFMIHSIDIFKDYPEKFEKELDIILQQVKIDFKKMVKNTVGETEDVKKFMKQKDSSYYYSNNYKNNNYIDNYKENVQNNVYKYKYEKNIVNKKKRESNKKAKELELYNDFEVKKYGPKYQRISLNISNKFIANNNNNNYYEKNTHYTSKNNKHSNNDINNIIESEDDDENEKPKKKDIIGCLANIDKNNKSKYTVDVVTSNIIEANNNNNNIEKSNKILVYENNKIEEKTVTNYHLKEKKSQKKNESKNNEFSEIDILNKEIKKDKDKSSNKKDNLYTTNYKFDVNKVNNNNNRKIETNYENRVTNCDIKVNTEINIYDKSKIQSEDENIEFKYEKNNLNNNKEIKKDNKLIIDNKDVNIDIKAKGIKGDLVDTIEINLKAEINEKKKDSLSNKQSESNKKKRDEEEKEKTKDEAKQKIKEEEERKKRKEEERKRREEKEKRERWKKVYSENCHNYGLNDRYCQNCSKVCHKNCRAGSNRGCIISNHFDSEKCKFCGCSLNFHRKNDTNCSIF